MISLKSSVILILISIINFTISYQNMKGKFGNIYSQITKMVRPNYTVLSKAETTLTGRISVSSHKNTIITEEKHSIVNKLKDSLSAVNRGPVNEVNFNPRRREDAYDKTDPEDDPHAMALVLVDEHHTIMENSGIELCSGTLLTDEWVLTSAHCFKSGHVEEIYVYAGGYSNREVVNKSGKNISLPLSSQLKLSREFFLADDPVLDIALIRLPEKFNLTKTVNTIKLSSRPWEYHSYHNCSTTAFGMVAYKETNEDDLRRKTHKLEVKQPCLCFFRFDSIIKDILPSIRTVKVNDYFCARPLQDYGICVGDSGGGLVCDNKIVGVNMGMGIFEDIKYCEKGLINFAEFSEDNTLTIFQATCHALPWINGHVKLFSEPELEECRVSSAPLTFFLSLHVVFGILVVFIAL